MVFVSICAAFLLQVADGGLYANEFSGGFAIWFFGLILVGTPVALLYGGPAYFFLRKKALARWRYVILVGFLPALVFFAMAPLGGVLCMVCGVSVASLTHMMCRNRV